MSKNTEKRGITPDPAETSRDSQQHQHQAKEGEFRNADKREDRAASFDDDAEAREENSISENEARTEKEDRKSKGK